ncbi:DUF3549 family protein [Halomonas shantousis]
MQPIHTLTDFFTRTGADVHFYDMGRCVAPFAPARLAEFESGTVPWPLPWQGQARFACVFRFADESMDPLIWFLALPLDEEGRLVLAPRDAFISRLIETLGHTAEQAGHRGDDEAGNLMKDNPLAFTPELTQRAILHARAAYDFSRPASQHHELTEAYLTGAQEVDWQFLGLQGIADFSVRYDDEQARILANRLAGLPVEVVRPLCYCMEHVGPEDALATALHERGRRAREESDMETFHAIVRALGASPSPLAGEWYDELLAGDAAEDPGLLTAIAARGWAHLEHAERLPRFLARLAENSQLDFAALVRDLALIPRLRLPVLMTLRQAEPASPVGQRLAELSR